MKKICFALLILFSVKTFSQKFESLAPTPPMGWNSWNTFQTKISEQLVMETADMMVSSGMKDAGYVYLVLDDGWMAMERDSKTGDLIADPKKFPHGMKAVADYVHSKGLKFGLYNCAGTKTCAGYPGTRGYEYQDARLYASFEIDFLKFDWCYAEGINAKEAYTTMSKALRAAGRPMIFSLCDWGSNKPWQWAANVGQMWRTTGDISNVFDGIKDMGTWKANGVMMNADSQDTIGQYAGPGHWNDPDMLEIGNGMTMNEDRAHFSIWCIMAAPLIAGNDIRKMTKETNAILTNKNAIAIDQDTMGVEGFKVPNKDSVEVWIKPLSNDNWAICFFNRSSSQKQLQYSFKANAVGSAARKIQLQTNKNTYKILNVWTNKDAGTTAKDLNVPLASHDVLMLRLSK